MSLTEGENRGGAFGEIYIRLIQDSQEQRNAFQVTPISNISRTEAFRQNLTVRFGTNEASVDANIVDTQNKGVKSTALNKTTGGQQQQQYSSEWHHTP